MIPYTQKKDPLKYILLTITILALLILSVLYIALRETDNSQALSGSEFRPGRIIDDAIFYNKNALNPSAIQSFLDSRVTTCDTAGTLPATEYGRSDLTHAQYAALRGWSAPPYVCLKDYKQDTPLMEAASGLCEGLVAKTNISASQIIYDIAQACAINPQVLLVLLQKEQSLVTDTWPLTSQYTNATGFACPDTAPCDPAYGGFFYQVYYAARQFQIYKKYPNNYNYVAGRTNNIYYNPNLSACGSSQVYIENQATAALYIYTPYQPNAAALSNLYGTGDSCSAYGNRNFWRLFTDWFGNTIYAPKSNLFLSNGTYEFINSASGKSLDVSGGSTQNGAPIQLYSQNHSGAQKWSIAKDADGYYSFMNIGSGKYLDVAGGSSEQGSKIQIWSGNGSCAQKWSIVSIGDNITLLNKCSGLALDIIGGELINNTKAQTWKSNNSIAQIWSAIATNLDVAVQDGLYNIQTVGNTSISASSSPATGGASIQLLDIDSSEGQNWQLTRLLSGLYTIRNPASNRYLDVTDASTSIGAPVHVYNKSFSCAQKWSVNTVGSGLYEIRSSCSDLVLDVVDGTVSLPGSSVQVYTANQSNAQKWNFAKLPSSTIASGTYSLKTKSGLALDITGGSKTDGTPVQLYTANQSNAQKWVFQKQLDGSYAIYNPGSGKYLDLAGANTSRGSSIQLYSGNGSCAQRWNVSRNTDSTYSILSSCSSQYAIDVPGGRISTAGIRLQLYDKNGSVAQSWALSIP